MDWLLIRCTTVGERERALRDALAGWFGPRIRFVVDGPGGGEAIGLTPQTLAALGLVGFPTSGWRCGDYCYYVAAAALPKMQRAWLIESDVWPSFPDPADFFALLADDDADLLAPRFTQRGPEWFWFDMARQVLGTEAVHGCLFPVTRLSRRAILHLAAIRRETLAAEAARPREVQPDNSDAAPFLVPNDESFVATVIARDGFTGRNLSDICPAAFDPATFGWDAPLIPAEARLPELAGRMLHPVLTAKEAREKLAFLARRFPDRLARRRAEATTRLGHQAWAEWSGEG